MNQIERRYAWQGRSLSPWYVKATGASLAIVLCMGFPAAAFADVRQDDLVAGTTVEERELSDEQCPDITAEFAYVVDGDGVIYFQRNDTDSANIASITKIMTAIVALENAPDDLAITVSENAASIGESSANLEAGDTMSLHEALKAMMIPSGNDAAQAIAESVGGNLLGNWDDPAASTQTFVDAMNAKAEALGMTNTLFTNPHGLDDEGFEGDQHSSAADVAIMCSHAMKEEDFRSVVSEAETTCTVTREGADKVIDLAPTNNLIGEYTGTCGIKTGFTDLAGGCFAGACHWEGKDLYAVVLASENEETRFADTRTLWDWVYGNTVQYALATSQQTVKDERSGDEVPLVAKVGLSSWIDKTVDATLADPAETVAVFTPRGEVSQSVEYDQLEGTVHAGDKVGTVTYEQDGEVVATANLVAVQTVEGPKWYEKAWVWIQRLVCNFTGKPKVAESTFLNQPEAEEEQKAPEAKEPEAPEEGKATEEAESVEPQNAAEPQDSQDEAAASAEPETAASQEETAQ